MAKFGQFLADNIPVPTSTQELAEVGMPSFSKIPQFYKNVEDFAGQARQVVAFDTKNLKPAQISDWFEDTGKDLKDRAIVYAESQLGNLQVLDYGISPPISRTLIELVANPPNISAFEFPLEIPPDAVNKTIKALYDASPVSGFPVEFLDGDPVLFATETASWARGSASNVIEMLNLPIDDRLKRVLENDAVWMGASEGLKAIRNLPEASKAVLDTLNTGVSNMAGMTASAALASVNWQQGIQVVGMTVSSLEDGFINKNEAKNIGAAGGALIGASIGSFFGPWGTLIGSAIGTMVGFITSLAGQDTIDARVFQMASAKEEALARMREAQAAATALQREKWISNCQNVYEAYFRAVESAIRVIAVHWAAAETQTGWRFDLRWFDPNPGTNFTPLHAKRDLSDPSLRFAMQKCYRTGVDKQVWLKTPSFDRLQAQYCGTQTYDRGFDCKYGLEKHTISYGGTECHLVCPNSFGCPYPDMSGKFDPRPVAEVFDFNSRAANALAARGFPYVDPKRRGKTVDGEFFHQCAVWAGAHKAKETDTSFTPTTTVDFLLGEIKRLQMATNVILMDINRTSASVKTEHDMWANSLVYKQNGLGLGVQGRAALFDSIRSGTNKSLSMLKDPELSQALKSKQTSDATKNLLLWGGVGALGYFALKGGKK